MGFAGVDVGCFFFFFLVVMEAILEKRITNCGISAAGRRRGALPTQVEHRRDRTEEREAGANREGRRAPGAHPGSRGRGVTLPSGRRGRGEPGPSWGERWGSRGQLPVRGTAGPGLGSGAAPAGCGWRGTSLSSSSSASSSSSCASNPASHGGDTDRVRAYLVPTLGQPFVSHLFISYFAQPCSPDPGAEGLRRSLRGEADFGSEPEARSGCGERGWAEISLLITRVPLLPRVSGASPLRFPRFSMLPGSRHGNNDLARCKNHPFLA
ncbi:uncharacterized protein LOC119703820 [Motacilla alba alba]|uniref:uncharacterized protein LOC119703820 n=1 Tax=Motacilla alba alba TaxID=1094192 RepID=UPI0018D56DCC|nr:uncharacterized protein LOC119703820 [Motacilla alba alba]